MTEPRPLLQIEGLSRHFRLPGGEVVRAVDGVDLSLASGEVLGLVGESGSGKSTLGKTLLGLHDKTAGSVWFRGKALPQRYRRADFRRFAGAMQMVFQDPYSTLNPRLTVGESLAEPLHLQGRGGEALSRVPAWLQRVGLGVETAGRYPHEFSGGQRQRLGIARALIAEPALLVCDEPVSALDVSVQAQIINLLQDLRRSMNLAMLFIAHDLGVVRYLCDRTAVMYRGRIVEEAPTAQLFEAPRHPYTALLLQANPVADPDVARRPRLQAPPVGREAEGGCAFAPRCPRAGEACRVAPPLLPEGEGHRLACHDPVPLSSARL